MIFYPGDDCRFGGNDQGPPILARLVARPRFAMAAEQGQGVMTDLEVEVSI